MLELSTMTLLDAPQYDPAKTKRRRIQIGLMVVVVLVLLVLGWLYRNWPAEHAVDQLFSSLQKQDYEAAYGIYFDHPNWRQRPQEYSRYTYADFYRDWGPGGEWGIIKSHRIYGSASTQGGVVVEVVVNERADRARILVEKSDKTLTVYPY